MHKEEILKNAKILCKDYNQNTNEIKLKISKNEKMIYKFYKTYDGIKEFLYIPTEEEIKESIENGAIYLCVTLNDNLAGVVKASKIEFPYPFFNPPKTIKNSGDFWGVSGLYVHKRFQGKRLSSVLVKNATILAELCNACGVYADFDYRNIASMRVLSKFYNFLGYTDGRKGSIDEATIYTTFFKCFNFEENGGNIELDLDFDDKKAVKSLNKVMDEIGSSTETKVDYCGGYNIIKCLDKPYKFSSTKIIMEDYVKYLEEKKLKNNQETLDK